MAEAGRTLAAAVEPLLKAHEAVGRQSANLDCRPPLRRGRHPPSRAHLANVRIRCSPKMFAMCTYY